MGGVGVRVLVTGGLGFTGSAVARRLLDAGHGVTVLTSASSVAAQTVPAWLSDASIARADLRDRSAIAEIVSAGRFDGICHLGALTAVRESIADPLRYWDVNLTGTLALLTALDAARASSGSVPRLVLASTGAVYGARDGIVSEDEPAAPVHPYGASKLAAEQAIAGLAGTGRLAAVSLRCFNIAGAIGGVTDGDLTRIIPKTLAVAAGRADRLEINGDGRAVREYTHVLDVARAFELAMLGATPGQHRIYNVGSGQGVTLADLVATARQVTGRSIEAVHCPPRPEARIVMASCDRIRAELGWKPEHSSLQQILTDAWSATQGQGTSSRPAP